MLSPSVKNILVGIFGIGCAVIAVAQGASEDAGFAMRFEEVRTCTQQDPALENSLNRDQAKLAMCVNVPASLAVGRVLLAHGKIERNSSDILAQVTESWPPGSVVVLQSTGGDLLGGLRVGQVLRAKGFSAYVSAPVAGLPSGYTGKCFSACAYAFLGGTMRHVDPQGQLGVHQFRMLGAESDSVKIQKVVVILAKYLDVMGVSRQLLDRALMTDPKLMLIVGPQDRRAWQIETFSP